MISVKFYNHFKIISIKFYNYFKKLYGLRAYRHETFQPKCSPGYLSFVTSPEMNDCHYFLN